MSSSPNEPQRATNQPPGKVPAGLQSACGRTTTVTATAFSGPVPSPRLLAGYEEIQPGLADRIFRMTEAEAAHRHNLEIRIVQARIDQSREQFKEARRGQICAVAITVASLGAGLCAALKGHDVTGGILGVGGIGGIVTTFVIGRERS